MSWRCEPCGQTISGLKPEHCPVCHETFANTRAGDRHRVGPHDGDRRCLTIVEMLCTPVAKDQPDQPLFDMNARGNWTLASGPNPFRAEREEQG
jgi:hypothetical protein